MLYLGRHGSPWRDDVKRFQGCEFDVTQPDVFPWEHNQKVYWRTCRNPAQFKHEGKFLCTHHAKSTALRMIVESGGDRA